MKIILTVHAKVRMRERGVSHKDIEVCVMRPARVAMETDRIRRFQKSFAYGTIEVVAEIRGNRCIVITVYPL